VREQAADSEVRRTRIKFGGVKHAVDQEKLVQFGLLPPLDLAASIADEFRLIKRPLIENATISLGVEGHQTNVIMVASAMPGAGKSFCAMNLAVGISLERELHVLLVDADVAKPHISTALGLADRPGLTDILEDESLAIEDVLVRCDLNDIQVLPAGRRHSQATELLASERMIDVISELATRYTDRLIILDSPPLLATSEAQAMAQKVGQIALVIEYGKSQQNEVREALDTLDADKPVNVILNKCLYSRAGGYYGGRYGNYGFDFEK
jgi:receptor protein-tyrosine kinase